MDRWTAMQVFARVARLESFSAAARELRISPAAVSRHVAQLEAHLGVRLVERTTRRVQRTESGDRYLARCEQILNDVESLEIEIGGGQGGVVGRLRVSAGVALGQGWVAPLLAGFLTAHPAVDVELVLRDDYLDLVAEGVDVAVRAGPLADSSLRARRLTPTWSLLVASPDFLARAGTPASLTELSRFDGLCDTNRRDPLWVFPAAGAPLRVRPRTRLAINHPQAIRDAAVAGLGIALLPYFSVAEALASGALVEILPDLSRSPIPIHAVYPAHRERTPKTESFVAHLVEHFRIPQPPTRVPVDSSAESDGQS